MHAELLESWGDTPSSGMAGNRWPLVIVERSPGATALTTHAVAAQNLRQSLSRGHAVEIQPPRLLGMGQAPDKRSKKQSY